MLDIDQRSATSDSTAPEKAKLEFLSHEPITSHTEDRLGYGSMARAIASVVSDRTTVTPLTIAISAPWGVGKTSLANLVEEQLRTRSVSESPLRDDLEEQPLPEPLIIWFNAWTHSDAPNLGTAFGSAVARELGRQRNPWRRLWRPLATSMLTPRQRFVRELSILGVAALVAVVSAFVARDFFAAQIADVAWLSQWTGFVDRAWGEIAVTAFIVGWGALTLWTRVATGTRAIAKFFNDPSSEASKGTVADVRRRLGTLVKDARYRGFRKPRRRILIFVDDLERTTPPRAVDICEVSSQLLNFEGVITVFVADMPAIAAAAQVKHGGAAGGYQPRDGLGGWAHEDRLSYGRLFLQKLVQFQVDLPPATLDMALEIAFPAIESAVRSSDSETVVQRVQAWLNTRLTESRLAQVAILVVLGGAAVWLFIIALGATSWRWAWWIAAASLVAVVVVLAAILVKTVASQPETKRSPRELAELVVRLVVLGSAWVWLFIVALSSESWSWAWWSGVILMSLVLAVGLIVWGARTTASLAREGQSTWSVAFRMSALLLLGLIAIWLLVAALGSESWTWAWWVGVAVALGGLLVAGLWLTGAGRSISEAVSLITMAAALGVIAVWLFVVALGSISWTWAWWATVVLAIATLVLLGMSLGVSESSARQRVSLITMVVVLGVIALGLLLIALRATSWVWAWWLGFGALVGIGFAVGWFEVRGQGGLRDGDDGHDATSYEVSVWQLASTIALTTGATVFIVWLFIVASSSSSWTWVWWLGFGWSVLVVLGNLDEIRDVIDDYFYERSAARRIRDTVDKAWDTEIELRRNRGADPSGTTPAELPDAVLQRLREEGSSDDVLPYVVAKSRSFVESLAKDSKIHTRAKMEIATFVPPIPRSAIRLANKLSFVIHVAIGNGLLRQSSELSDEDSHTAARIGKWTVLTERWPELAWAIALEPGLMGELELAAATSKKALSKAIARYPQEVIREPEALLRLLGHGEMLEGHIRELVYMRRIADLDLVGKERQQILDLLTVERRPMSPGDVAAMARRSLSSTQRLMAKMASDDQLVRTDDTYSLASSWDSGLASPRQFTTTGSD